MSYLRLYGKSNAVLYLQDFSIVMEFADDGDLFGKCADLRKNS